MLSTVFLMVKIGLRQDLLCSATGVSEVQHLVMPLHISRNALLCMHLAAVDIGLAITYEGTIYFQLPDFLKACKSALHGGVHLLALCLKVSLCDSIPVFSNLFEGL